MDGKTEPVAGDLKALVGAMWPLFAAATAAVLVVFRDDLVGRGSEEDALEELLAAERLVGAEAAAAEVKASEVVKQPRTAIEAARSPAARALEAWAERRDGDLLTLDLKRQAGDVRAAFREETGEDLRRFAGKESMGAALELELLATQNVLRQARREAMAKRAAQVESAARARAAKAAKQ